MKFNDHSNLLDKHAFLSASKYHWINYDEEKLILSYERWKATEIGTRLHAFANECILLRQKLPKTKQTLNMYVNDAIGYKMTPEQVLYYSDNCFGTADTISFSPKKSFLRIHDLKTGVTQTSMHQLEIYAALFCLEYKVKPSEIEMELRIYQNDEMFVHTPTVEDIIPIIDKIIVFDKRIEQLKQEG